MPTGAYTTFRGVAVDSTSILSAYPYTGDANLDGYVNDPDVTVIGTFYGQSNKQWYHGDFDFTGTVVDDDVTLINAYYNPSGPAA